MVKLDLKLVQKHEMYCVEAILASVAVWFGRRYEMIFSQLWNLKLREENPDPRYFGWRLWVDSGDQIQLLEQYHGIGTISHEVADFGEVLDIAKGQISAGSPIVVWINYDHVPLIPEKIRLSETFPFLITGIDEINKGVYCLDAHYLKKIIFLSFDNFQKGYSGCITFSLAHDERRNVDWREIIKDNAHSLRENDSFEIMRELSRRVNDLKKNGWIDLREMIERLKMIYRSRLLFSDCAAYLAEDQQAPVLVELQKHLKQLSNQWYLAWGCLSRVNLQLSIQKNMDFDSAIENIGKKILDLANGEEELCNRLEKVSHGEAAAVRPVLSSSPGPPDPPLPKRYQLQYVDISEYLNNEGFAVDSQTSRTASLSTGQFFLSDDLPAGDILENEGIRFYFPRPVDGANDNIVCAGQIIHFAADHYPALFVLGCADWGHQSEMMDIHYDDGSVTSLPLEISDWSYQIPFFGEVLIWEGKCALRDGDDVSEIPWFKGHLFGQTISLDSGRRLTGIHLPDNTNIHLFAMTLGKA